MDKLQRREDEKWNSLPAVNPKDGIGDGEREMAAES